MDNDSIVKIRKSFEDADGDKEKIGIDLNIRCKHPILDKEIPVYVANFVLDNYGEGAIFGCPAHDERDYEFAKKYNLPIIKVIDCLDTELPYAGDGKVINSPILEWFEKGRRLLIRLLSILKRVGNWLSEDKHKIRDWGVSMTKILGLSHTSNLL